MIVKTLEVRDSMTCISVVAIKPGPRNEAERHLWARCGFGTDAAAQSRYVLVAKLSGNRGMLTSDPYAQRSTDRTMREAHLYIREHFDELANGAVVDIEYILGESATPKRPDAESWACGAA